MSRGLYALILATCIAPALTACFSTAHREERTTTARVYERCDLDGAHCVNITCDRDADKCWQESQYASNESYRHSGHWVCDADGDKCRYEYSR